MCLFGLTNDGKYSIIKNVADANLQARKTGA